MSTIKENLALFKGKIPESVRLIAVSKTKPIELLQEAIDAHQLDLGENKVQELREKHEVLSKDVRWHMIGHLQRNKVKYIAAFVYMIHAVDSLKLLREINKRALENNRSIKVLLQIHIASEEAKFGFSTEEIEDLFKNHAFDEFKNIELSGLMGMATNTSDTDLIRSEFSGLQSLFIKLKSVYPEFSDFSEISMGMSNDYEIAIEEGSSMIRIGSSIFGARNYPVNT